jgi:tRNA-2-methylthio-N6-dimethylallyladenosine synthase
MGCQMNVLDSELVMGQLLRMGYEPISEMVAADLVLINTCSVRDHAEHKALSYLGELRKPKERNPEMIVGVIGCMAERDGVDIFRKAPHIDLLCGPGELNKIPALIEDVLARRGPLSECATKPKRSVALAESLSRRSSVLDRALEFDSVEALDMSRTPEPGTDTLQSYIRVQRGCDKFCTFCVVPFTRGPERSRPPQQIVDEAKMLVDHGAREVTLLGQTVNSYMHQDNGSPVSFADLLERVNDVVGIDRVRFVTSYPGDWTNDIFEAMRDLPNVCEYLHLPVQSGCDHVLQRMRRQYTVAQYDDLVHRAREIVPNITLATDLIVGFCGETDEEFDRTLALVERSRFKNVFVFKYSARPGTVADKRMADDVPDAVKRRRNQELLALQGKIGLENNLGYVGQTYEVLVEGYSKSAVKARNEMSDPSQREDALDYGVDRYRPVNQLTGRTRMDNIVVFDGDASLKGRLAQVRITRATALTLHGEIVSVEDDVRPVPLTMALPVVA